VVLDFQYWTESFTALGGLSLAVLQFLYGKYKEQKADKEIANLNADLSPGFEIIMTAERWQLIDETLQRLMASTGIDRVIFFIAKNGVGDPRRTYAFIQKRDTGDLWFHSFQNVALDDDYKIRLRELFSVGVHSIRDCTALSVLTLIGGIYAEEKVLSSFWVKLQRFMSGPNAFYCYCSFSSHTGEISNIEKVRCAEAVRIITPIIENSIVFNKV